MSDTSVDVPRSFEEKMKERIRESIGDLITDEELSRIIGVGIEEAFLKERLGIPRYPGDHNPPKRPSLIVEILKAEMEKQVEEVTKEWIASHKDELGGMVKQILEGGLAEAFLKGLKNLFSSELINLQLNIEQRIRGM